jgi:hypothetical protein
MPKHKRFSTRRLAIILFLMGTVAGFVILLHIGVGEIFALIGAPAGGVIARGLFGTWPEVL